MKKIFSVYYLGVLLMLAGCSYRYEDFSVAKDKIFPNLECTAIDDLPNPFYPSYKAQGPLTLGYAGYRFKEPLFLYLKEGKNLNLIDKPKSQKKYFELFDGIVGSLRKFSNPEKVRKLIEFLTSNKDDLIFGVDPNFIGSYGKYSKSPEGKVFFFYGFIYLKRTNEVYFMRVHDSNYE